MVHKRLRRIVRDKAHCQLGADKVCGRTMVCEQMQHLSSFLFAIVLDAMTEDDFVPMIVHALFEFEPAALLWLVNGPAGEDARDFGNIFLSVAAVHPEGMQFHQLAAVVLVESAAALSLCFLRISVAGVIGET